MCKGTPNAEGERGVIVYTASVAAFDGQIGQAAYAASKGGVVGDDAADRARARALRHSRHDDRAGHVRDADGRADSADIAEALGKMVPFPPRLGRPAEFASLVGEIIRNPMLNGEVDPAGWRHSHGAEMSATLPRTRAWLFAPDQARTR